MVHRILVPAGLCLVAVLTAAPASAVSLFDGTTFTGWEGDTGGVWRIAEVAYQVNENTENIGARRLHTVMERLLETVSFEASDRSGLRLTIDAAYVDDHLAELSRDEDLSRYIL